MPRGELVDDMADMAMVNQFMPFLKRE